MQQLIIIGYPPTRFAAVALYYTQTALQTATDVVTWNRRLGAQLAQLTRSKSRRRKSGATENAGMMKHGNIMCMGSET